ncbi:MAG: hypothetical protein LBM25_05365 [Bacteroidales bacterium]|jgi:hypothetical protein|nr:hypothetical protein [Bacteroidales bacterium]
MKTTQRLALILILPLLFFACNSYDELEEYKDPVDHPLPTNFSLDKMVNIMGKSLTEANTILINEGFKYSYQNTDGSNTTIHYDFAGNPILYIASTDSIVVKVSLITEQPSSDKLFPLFKIFAGQMGNYPPTDYFYAGSWANIGYGRGPAGLRLSYEEYVEYLNTYREDIGCMYETPSQVVLDNKEMNLLFYQLLRKESNYYSVLPHYYYMAMQVYFIERGSQHFLHY